MKKIVIVAAFAVASGMLQGQSIKDIDQAFWKNENQKVRQLVSGVLKSKASLKDQAEAEKYLARVYWTEKDYQSCQTQLDKIIKKYPGTEQQAYAYWLKGYCYLKNNQPELAESQFNIVITKFEGSEKYEDAFKRSAYLAYRNKSRSLDEQVQLFEQVMEKFPNSPEDLEITRSYAQLLWAKSERELTLQSKLEAEKAFKELENKAGDNETMLFEAKINQLGITMEKERLNTGSQSNDLKPFKQTIQFANEIVQNPTIAEQHKATALLILGEAHYFNSDYPEALSALGKIEVLKATEATNTQKAFGHYMKGLTHERMGNDDAAYQELIKTLDYNSSANFAKNDVQSLSLEWISYIAVQNNDNDLGETALAILQERAPESTYTKRAQHTFQAQQTQRGENQ